ncbi:MAG: hypothetical protein PF439_08230 [Helicobacteraceae bacterium]|jgi:hypothetical protein|nr:hypothetical protein [Helicobacteraceae bacterium]
MINRFYNTLLDVDLEYHLLREVRDGVILLTATSLDGEGIAEVIRINELAATFNLITKWDGENIQISKQSQ